MNEQTVSLDMRALPHEQRLAGVLEAWNGLQSGETLRLVNDHDPSPLQYLLRSQFSGQFQWQVEAQGPVEWVVRIKKLARAEAATTNVSPEQMRADQAALKELLSKLHAGVDTAQVKQQAAALLRGMDAGKLALLEQELIEEGMGRDEMRRLCDVHLEVMREGLDQGKLEAEPGHPIHTLMEEHKLIKQYLQDLQAFVEDLKATSSGEPAAADWGKARDIAHHLLEAEKHHQREEQVIFPALEQRGVTEPPQIMVQEHEELRARKRALDTLAQHPERHSSTELLQQLEEIGGYLVKELTNHIYKEDNIIYQIALQEVEPGEWAELKRMCDEIGYCCFTPGAHAQQAA